MSYGFGKNEETKSPIKLPKPTGAKVQKAVDVEQAVQAGQAMGFVSRSSSTSRKPGPKRTEPQGKLTLTGPKRVLERLQARCDAMGGVPYWQAIEDLLERTED